MTDHMTGRAAARLYRDKITNAARWQSFVPRVGDIVVSTPPKSGTTWVQAMLALLISGDVSVDVQPTFTAPWIDMDARPVDEVMARLAAQTGRRQVKSHTPFDGLPVWDDLRYIAVYRHPIDVHFSFRRHAANMAMEKPVIRFVDDPVQSFHQFVDEDWFDGGSLEMVVGHYLSALEINGSENVLMLHYAEMCRDPAGAMARIAAHVGIAHPPERMADLVQAASFENMKANAGRFAPGAGTGFWHSDARFFDTASSNKWEGVLSERDLAMYRARIAGMLTPAQTSWLERGGAIPV